MMKQAIVWKLILRSLQQQLPVMLLYVLESKGSSPGRQGFSMAVNMLGEMAGSIGGGIMEHKFVELALDTLKAGKKLSEVRQQFHNKEALSNQSGMICSGQQTVFLYTLNGNEEAIVNQIIAAIETYGCKTLVLSTEGIALNNEESEYEFSFEWEHQAQWIYKENLGIKDHLYIVGAGHCALALSKLMSTLNFFIHLYDDRNNLNTFELNTYVQEKNALEDYAELGHLVKEGKRSYVIVMTFGYRTDDVAVRALLGKRLNYLGLLGSATKINKMFSQYRAEGIDEDTLSRINAPAGLPIKSQSPEEIAVSIAAEIIRIRNSEK